MYLLESYEKKKQIGLMLWFYSLVEMTELAIETKRFNTLSGVILFL